MTVSRKTKYLAASLALVMLLGCGKKTTSGNPVPTPSTLDQKARDGIAAATGFLSKAQEQYLDQCKAAPAGGVCVTIHKGVAAQNVAIDALRTYCGYGASDGLDTACKPVANAADALQAALGNLSSIVNDVKGLVK